MSHRSNEPTSFRPSASHPSALHPSAGRGRSLRHRRGETTVVASAGDTGASLVIACGDCVMQHTTACDDCLVTFVLDGIGSGPAPVDPPAPEPGPEPLVLDEVEVIAVRRLARAGLVPTLRHEVAVP